MSYRNTLKNIVKFAKREYAEKKPLSLQVSRVKSKTIISRGLLPSLNLKQIKGTFYVITLEYNDYFRIYSFDKKGKLIGGENLNKENKLIKEISKATTIQYSLPRKRA